MLLSLAGQGYGQLGQAAGGWQHSTADPQQQHGGGELGGDSPGSSGARTELSQEEAGAIVAVVEYLVANFPRLSSGDGSPLYSATATHTLE